jgi:hypothetical protein
MLAVRWARFVKEKVNKGMGEEKGMKELGRIQEWVGKEGSKKRNGYERIKKEWAKKGGI